MPIDHQTTDMSHATLVARRSLESLDAANPFAGLRIAVTGGTSGLGLALVRELMHRGAYVAFVARGRDGVERTMRDLVGAHGIVGDLSNKAIFIRWRYRSWARLGASMF